MRSEGFYVNEKSTDTSWDRTSDLPICTTGPYPLFQEDLIQIEPLLQQTARLQGVGCLTA